MATKQRHSFVRFYQMKVALIRHEKVCSYAPTWIHFAIGKISNNLNFYSDIITKSSIRLSPFLSLEKYLSKQTRVFQTTLEYWTNSFQLYGSTGLEVTSNTFYKNILDEDRVCDFLSNWLCCVRCSGSSTKLWIRNLHSNQRRTTTTTECSSIQPNWSISTAWISTAIPTASFPISISTVPAISCASAIPAAIHSTLSTAIPTTGSTAKRDAI